MQAGFVLRRVRLATGLVLFGYLVTHFLNHSLGLVSLAAMEAGREWFLLLWRNPIGTVALYGALAIHLALAFWALYLRRSFNMPLWEATQLVLGMLVPPLLVIHLLGTRLSNALFDTNDTYAYIVLVQWVWQPWIGARQAAVLLIAWGHGCVGLHYWLRLRPWYAKAAPYLRAGALLLPVLALLGFAAAGREVARVYENPEWFAAAAATINFPTPEAVEFLYRLESYFLGGFFLLLAGVLAARVVRHRVFRRRRIAISYPGGRLVEVPRGTTILEASRMAGIPHASVCGGRGRCSTCRVRVREGLDRLPPASPEELKVLKRVGAAPDVRLACQTKPLAAVAVEPLLPPSAGLRHAWGEQ